MYRNNNLLFLAPLFFGAFFVYRENIRHGILKKYDNYYNYPQTCYQSISYEYVNLCPLCKKNIGRRNSFCSACAIIIHNDV